MTAFTLPGVPFASRHSILLSAWGRSRGYKGNVWVSGPLLHHLRIHPRAQADGPVMLHTDSGSCVYYHTSQFTQSLDELRGLWKAYEVASRDAQAQQRPCSKLPEAVRPLDTNGEPFPADVEEKMALFSNVCSRYWASADEAAYIFQSPFPERVLRDESLAVAVPRPLCNAPLLYFNVSLSQHPASFSEKTCLRYDPYNYSGRYYRPITSIELKRAAIELRCIHQPRWVTPHRVRSLGLGLLPHTVPVRLGVRSRCEGVSLVNISFTSNPAALEKVCSVVDSTPITELDSTTDDHLTMQTVTTPSRTAEDRLSSL